MAKKHTLTIEEKLQQALVPKEEQPYEIPDNWCWVKLEVLLKEICNGTTIKQNKAYKTAKVTRIESLQNNTIDFNRLGNIVDEKLIKDKDWYEDGDIVLSHINSIEHVGKTAMITKDMLPLVHGMNLLRLRLKTIIQPKFFQLYTQSVDYKTLIINRVNRAVNQVSINQKNLCTLETPLTSLKEQQRIVTKIESLFAKLDKAKDFIQATIDNFEQNKMAVLHKAFTGELTANWRKSHGIVQPIEYISLNDCGTWSGGGTPSTSHQEYWENGNILWITSKDMKVKYITSTQKMVNEYGIEHSSAKYIEKPALLFVIRSGILRNTLPVCMVQKPFTINQDLKALIPKDGIELAYVYWICKSQEFTILSTCMKNGTTVESISFDKLKDFKIPIPDIEEQREVVRILDYVITKEQHIMELATKNLAQIELLKKSILAKAFRGGLGTNDGDDGSAMELLKSILANEE